MARRSFERKLDRAREHTESLHASIRGWFEAHPNPFVEEKDDTDKTIIRFDPAAAPLPEEIPLLLGDALQALRASLDHLVFDIAKCAYPNRIVPDRIAEKLEFPIFGTRAMSKGEQRAKIGPLPDPAQAVILGLQPHVLGGNYVRHWLWLLHELARIDRHRFVHTARFLHSDASMGGENVGFRDSELWGGTTEPGAVVASFYLESPDPTRPMKVELNFSVEIAVMERLVVGVNPVQLLRDMHAYLIRRPVALLSPFLC